jgi:hypothetical protein
MSLNIAVIVADQYAVLTLESIKKAMPGYDPYIVYVGFRPPQVVAYLEGHHDTKRTLSLNAFDVPSLFAVLKKATNGPMLCVEGGMLVLKDPSIFLPIPERMGECSTALSREYMYGRRMGQTRNYQVLDISLSDDQTPRVTYHDLDKEFVGDKFIHLHTSLRFGADPLIENFFGGRECIRHATEATTAAVIDFLPQALNPETSVIETYSYPLDIYAFFAERLKAFLPPDAIAAMRRNGRRSSIISPLRKIIRPPSHQVKG